MLQANHDDSNLIQIVQSPLESQKIQWGMSKLYYRSQENGKEKMYLFALAWDMIQASYMDSKKKSAL